MNKKIVISVLFIFMLTAGSYLVEKMVFNHGLESAKIIKVTENNKVVAYISADVLKKLAEQTYQQDEENVYMGPSLLLTMNATGTDRFSQVEVKGKGQKDTITLNNEEIKDDLKIFLESDGTMDLMRNGNVSDFLIKEITEISIKK